jgi:hypothetical protein
VITIGAGTVFEDGITFPSGLDVTIRGAGRDQTFIDASLGSDEAGTFEMINTGQTLATVIENLTIQNGSRGAVAALIGGAVAMRGTSLTLRRVDFVANTAPGGATAVNARDAVDLRIEDCRFFENTATSILTRGLNSVELVNCVIGDANLPFSTYDAAVLVNCTIDGSVRARGDAAVALINSIVTGNLQQQDNSTFANSRSMYSGATGDNIDGLPTFVDAASHDYRLAAGSLGIDAADGDAYATAGGGATDVMGLARTVDDCATADSGNGSPAFLDMGAYEYAGTTSPDSDGDGAPDDCDACPNRKPGDVNGDGDVSGADAAAMAAALLDAASATADDLCAADVNGDGTVDGEDVQGFVGLVMGA